MCYSLLCNLWVHMQVLFIFLKLYEWKMKKKVLQLETFEPLLIAVRSIFVTAVLKRGLWWERKHTSFFFFFPAGK